MTRVATTGIAQSPPLAAWLAWTSVVMYFVLAASAIALEASVGSRTFLLDVWVVIALLGYALIGALIVSSRPRHPIGWMFCALTVTFGLGFFSRQYAIRALAVAPGSLPAGELMAWLGFWIDLPALAVGVVFLPLLFPDGRLPSPRWRPVAWFAGALVLIAVVTAMVAPETYEGSGFPNVRNPVGLYDYTATYELIGVILQPLLLAVIILSAVALLDRVRRADAVERQQIKWFGYAGALVALSFIIEALARFFPALTVPSQLVNIVALTALPVAVGVAVLRYRLYDVDLIVNRTLVYVLLTAVLAGLYTAAVALFQRLFVATTGQGSDLAIVMTLFVLATVFTPIKNALQERVDRRIKPVRPSATAVGRPRGEIDDLVMLAELHRSGVLTDDEFAAKKKQVLGI